MNFQEIMACHKANADSYKQLTESVAKNNIVPFIGAGLSSWQYPAWSRLLIDMASDYGIEDEIQTMLDSGQYEEAASRLEEEMTSFDFLRVLEKKYDPTELEEIELPEIYEHITSLWRGSIVTTNFDRILEKAYRNAKIDLDAITPYSVFVNKVESSIQQNKNLIIKLHGDVNDKSNMVLTKDKYDICYGENEVDKKLPMPKMVERILQTRQLLFLGCSLQQDRTMQVIQAVNNCTHFAIVSLPEDAKDDKGVFYKSYLERNKHLANHSIVRIWYPYGEHGAVEVILKELAKAFGKKPKDDPKEEIEHNDFRYEHLHDLFGRDDNVDEIVKDMSSSKGGNVFVVSGPPGIGKTEVCRGIHKKLKEDIITLDMPYVDCTGVTTIEAFYYKLAEEFHMPLSETITKDHLLKLLRSHIDTRTKASKFFLYFDNWEDVWYAVKDTVSEKKELHNFMQILKNSQTDVLISTREYPDGWSKTVHPLLPLDEDAAKKLFLFIYDSKQNCTDEVLLNELLKELDGYPLALVLVASQASKLPSLKMILNKWREAKAETGNDNHNSMEIAVRMSWNAIAHLESAKHIWGVISLASAEVSFELLKEIMALVFKDEWVTGLTALKDANLVFYRDEKIAMLAPLKNLCFKLHKETGTKLEEECIIELGNALLKRILNATTKEPDYITSHHAFMNVFDEILNVTEKLMVVDSRESQVLLKKLVVYMLINYVRSYKSFHVVEKLCQHYNTEPNMLAALLKCCGDLQKHLGEMEKAEKSFIEAEKIFREENDTQGIANVLDCLAELQKIIGEYSKAELSYFEAESLFRSINDKQGLANALFGRGDLLKYLGELEKAKQCYTEAETIYRNNRENLGLANVLKSQGNMWLILGEIEKAQEYYFEAEALYRDEKCEHGLSIVLREQGDLLIMIGDLDGAEKYYLQTEVLARSEKSKLSLANILISLGDLQCFRKNFEEADQRYSEAETLYKSIGCNLGLANLYLSRGDLLSILNANEEALGKYNDAARLYEQEQDKTGLANVCVNTAILLINNNLNIQKSLMLLDTAKLHYASQKMDLKVEEVQEIIDTIFEAMESASEEVK